jgi:hypothetical protein
VQPGSWRPDPRQFALFATAAARRYSGQFPDPAVPGSLLPRVSLWQAWNEPNLDYYLSPQWVRAGRGWRSVAPAMYRRLLNAFYAAIKGVAQSDTVVMGGTAPYGDPPGLDPLGQQRTAPVAFYRAVFCLRGGVVLRPAPCPAPAHLDGIDHHPYGVGGPTWHAINPDDVAVPDIHKITRVLAAAQRWRRVLPGGRKSIWVSELGWSSRPPNPQAVPVQKDARWYEQAFYVLWEQGVGAILPLEIGDPPANGNYASVFESGLYYSDGRPKPIARAFRFPFITARVGGGAVRAWGRAPQAGRLAIEVRRGRRWIVIRRLSMRREEVFATRLPISAPAELRALVGAQASLTWHQA